MRPAAAEDAFGTPSHRQYRRRRVVHWVLRGLCVAIGCAAACGIVFCAKGRALLIVRDNIGLSVIVGSMKISWQAITYPKDKWIVIKHNVPGNATWPIMPQLRREGALLIPLWVVLVAAVGGLAGLCRAGSINALPGCCPRCHYCLTGNVSGRCPECGWRCKRNRGLSRMALPGFWRR